MSIDLTPERTLELLRRAVDEKGADYVYPGAQGGVCLYREPDGSPSCIVGHVLLWAGATPDDLVEGFGAARVARRLGLPDDVAKALGEAQYTQDHRNTWGEALADAEAILGDQS